MTVLGLILGIVLLSLLYLGTMSLYFRFRRKYPSVKYAIELSFIFLAYVCSVAVKVAILLPIDSSVFAANNIFAGAGAVFTALYSGIGGLAFEGLGNYGISMFLNCLYVGTSLFAGMVFVSVATAKVSYEIFSRVLLSFTCFKNKDIFVFTSVTEDTMLLAEDIVKTYSNNDAISNGRKPLIIFAGSELEPFDRKDPLCNEIMARGYVYWSYPNEIKAKTSHSVLDRLGLYVNNNKPEARNYNPNCSIHFFALGINKKMRGLEAENSDIVFDEIQAIVQKCNASQKKRLSRSRAIPNLDFYLLTDYSINFEYYQRAFADRIISAYAQLGQTISTSSPEINDVKSAIQLHIINEASASAKNLAVGRLKLLKRQRLAAKTRGETVILGDNKPNDAAGFRLMVLGFGLTGQKAFESIYTNAAYIDEKGLPAQFVADVYDTDMSKYSGVYATTHPLVSCISMGKEVMPKPMSQVLEDTTADAGLQQMYALSSVKDLRQQMCFPRVYFHEASCLDSAFSSVFGSKIENGKTVFRKNDYDAFVVALGSDESNILMANAIIDDIKRHSYYAKHDIGFRQTVFVHIRNEKNHPRVNWTTEEEDRFPHLRVVCFGNREELYSYAEIINRKEDMLYNEGYQRMAQGKSFEDIKKLIEACGPKESKANESDGNNRTYPATIFVGMNEIFKVPNAELRQSFSTVNLFDQESNDAIKRFGNYFSWLNLSFENVSHELLINMLKLEHDRWNRFYISNGWSYSLDTAAWLDATEKNIKKSYKLHVYLSPFDILPITTKAYDFVNVSLSYSKEV